MTESVTRYARTEDGVRIGYEFAEGRDPVLLVVPKLGSQPTVIKWAPPWRAYLDALGGDNALAIFSHRGIGLSSAPPRPITLQHLVSDIAAVANALPGRELYVAASGGGCVPALEFVAAHPDRVRGIYLDGPTAGLPPAQRAAMKADPLEALFMNARVLFNWDEHDAVQPRSKELLEGMPLDIFWESVAACEDYDFVAAVQRISVPVLLRGYDYDREAVAAIAATCPQVLLDLESNMLLGPAEAERQRELMAPHLDARPSTNGRSETGEAGPAPNLTARQLEVIRLAAQGKRDKQIAEELSISAGTARRHMSDILNRTGQPNRTAAVTYAREHGLLN